MSNISAVEAKLPPGFRFHPRDDELICDYLMRKAATTESEHPADDSLLMIDVDLNKCEPWDIPETACVGGKEWYFYSQRDRKYATGLRTNRATASGYWKATGKDRPILRKGTLVGMRKTLVFYQGRAPKGQKTDWVMHEFRLEGPLGPPPRISSLKEDWVLCRVSSKNREVASKPSCFGLDRGISSLPPLMDSYITFDPTQQPGNIMNSDFGDEQVPCFSNIFSQQPQLPSTIFPHLGFLNTVPAKNNDIDVSVSVAAAAASYGSSSSAAMAGLGYCFGSISYNPSDKKMLKALRNQLNNVEANNNVDSNVKESSLSLGEGSSDSFLSEVGMPAGVSGWGHY